MSFCWVIGGSRVFQHNTPLASWTPLEMINPVRKLKTVKPITHPFFCLSICCILFIDPTKNIIKDNERISINEKKHIFIKIYLSHFILERDTQFVVRLRDRWEDIYSNRELLLAPYLLPVPRRCEPLHPLASRIIRDDLTPLIGYVSWLDWLSKSDRVVSFRLHTCSSGLPRRTANPLFTNHNVTACQSTWGH